MKVICPTCSTELELGKRCPSERGSNRCQDTVGHRGWHWVDFGNGRVVRWTGVTITTGCYGRLGGGVAWCDLEVGHAGLHRDRYGVAFSDPEEDEE